MRKVVVPAEHSRRHPGAPSEVQSSGAEAILIRLQRAAGNAATAQLVHDVQCPRVQRDESMAGDLATHSRQTLDALEERRLMEEVGRYGLQRDGGRFMFDGGLVYRGDRRPPSEIFATGFRHQPLVHALGLERDDVVGGFTASREFLQLERLKALMTLSPSAKTASAVAAARRRLIEAYANLWRPRTVLQGEKVLGGISTTQHLPMALPYGEGGYVYAIQLRSGGFDFTDVSPNLREVNAIDIDPIDVIAAAGPLKDVTDGGRYGELDAGEWEAGRVFINPASTVGGAVTRQALDAMHGHISLQGRQRVRPPGGQSKDDDPSL